MSAASSSGRPRTNVRDLVTISVLGQIAAPLEKGTPWRIGHDGRMRALPGSGGIVLSHRVGDPCVGLAADHVEPGVSIRNEARAPGAAGDAANQALQSYACVGDRAVVVSGAARGARGVVTGKHGGIENVLIDFPLAAMRRMAIGDRVQVWARGLGLALPDFPDVALWNTSPRLFAAWPIRVEGRRLAVPVTHVIPAAAMGSGLGKNNVVRGDYDIQLADPAIVARHRLGSLRFGDIVAVADAENRSAGCSARGRYRSASSCTATARWPGTGRGWSACSRPRPTASRLCARPAPTSPPTLASARRSRPAPAARSPCSARIRQPPGRSEGACVMSWLEEELDELVRHATPGGCGCARCRAADEAARVRRPRPARRQTSARAVGPQLPLWRGWTPPVRLSDINEARLAQRRGQPVPQSLRPFLAPGSHVYRITRSGIDRTRPLTIGSTKSQSIAQRVNQHKRQARGDPQVKKRIVNLPDSRILVQAARFAGQMFPRRARTYEGWLQDRERPRIFNPHTTPFDEEAGGVCPRCQGEMA